MAVLWSEPLQPGRVGRVEPGGTNCCPVAVLSSTGVAALPMSSTSYTTLSYVFACGSTMTRVYLRAAVSAATHQHGPQPYSRMPGSMRCSPALWFTSTLQGLSPASNKRTSKTLICGFVPARVVSRARPRQQLPQRTCVADATGRAVVAEASRDQHAAVRQQLRCGVPRAPERQAMGHAHERLVGGQEETRIIQAPLVLEPRRYVRVAARLRMSGVPQWRATRRLTARRRQRRRAHLATLCDLRSRWSRRQ